MSQRDQDDNLHEVRRAAFELRQRDPAEAVKVLRKLIRKGGEIEPLAHGALGEILLEDFADYDGAIHHYQRLLQLVPRIAAGALGLARAHARNGEQKPAQDAYELAVTELESLANAARAGKGGEDAAGADEAILTALEAAVEERELCRDQGNGTPRTKVDPALLSWAEESVLFDDPEEPEDVDDWIRFAQLRGLLATLDGHLDEGLQHIERIGAEFPTGIRASLRSLLYEAARDLPRAAEEALTGARAPELPLDPDGSFRCAALLSEVKRVADARAVLEELRARLQKEDLPEELRDELVRRTEGHLSELSTGGLVTLGLKGAVR
jgi:tetratricopeptide (TPR) repeat protein